MAAGRDQSSANSGEDTAATLPKPFPGPHHPACTSTNTNSTPNPSIALERPDETDADADSTVAKDSPDSTSAAPDQSARTALRPRTQRSYRGLASGNRTQPNQVRHSVGKAPKIP